MSKKKKKTESEKRCLCGRCACDYEIAGYELKRDCLDNDKHECFFCKRMGFIFDVIYAKR